jgi:hypothetical protein
MHALAVEVDDANQRLSRLFDLLAPDIARNARALPRLFRLEQGPVLLSHA